MNGRHLDNSQSSALGLVPFAHVFTPMNILGDAVCQLFALAARAAAGGFSFIEKRISFSRGQNESPG